MAAPSTPATDAAAMPIDLPDENARRARVAAAVRDVEPEPGRKEAIEAELML